MAWVITHSNQTGHGFVTLLMIANHANAEGKKSFPSMKTLAKECRLSVRTIQRVILKLEASGELRVDRSAGRASHSYALPLMFNVDSESTLQPRQLVHVEGEHGQNEPPNVDKTDANVDRAVSTEPYNRNTNHKDPAHPRLMAFLNDQNGNIANPGKEGKAAKAILKQYTPEQAEECFRFLAGQPWRDTAVTWSTVEREIGTFVKKLQHGHSPSGEKILTDYGDWYTVEGFDGTPSKRFRTPEAFARETGRDVEEVKSKWN